MAHKYDLLLVNTETDKKKRHQPWYKERLETKYIKPRKLRGNSETLIGAGWTFLQKGSDDFRDGLPPETNFDFVGKGMHVLEPVVTGSNESLAKNAPPKKFTKHEAVYSKALPMQLQRRDQVEDIEFNLTQHPLALFPHLEESLPPDVFEDVVDVLDPEMNIDSETEDEDSQSQTEDAENQTSVREEVQSSRSVGSGKRSMGEDSQKKFTYRWLPKQEDIQKEERSRASRRKAESPTSDQQIQEVTRDFCSWVAGLGGESNNIEESTVMSLFASGYETKPALSVPIHVVELTNVPPELRKNTGSPMTKPSDVRQATPGSKATDKLKYTPSWVKVKYGAWYLSPKTWKTRPKEEPLQDPKEQQDKALSESKKKSHKLDSVLATMHGAKAFKDFVDKKSTRVPEFLQVVAEAQQSENKANETATDEGTERRRSRGQTITSQS